MLRLHRQSSFTQSNWGDYGFLFIVFLRSQLQQTLSTGNSSKALCNFTITEHACSPVRLFDVSCESQKKIWLLLHYLPETNLYKLRESLLYSLSIFFPKATILTHSNLVTLLKCSLESQRTYPVEVWKLFLQKATTALDQALVTFAAMVNPIPQFHKIGVTLREFCVKPKWFFQF